jgi:hypothetical protein
LSLHDTFGGKQLCERSAVLSTQGCEPFSTRFARQPDARRIGLFISTHYVAQTAFAWCKQTS